MGVKSMIDLGLWKKDRLRYVQDMSAVRRIGRGLSDYHGLRGERWWMDLKGLEVRN